MAERKKYCPRNNVRVFPGCAICIGSLDEVADRCARYAADDDAKEYDKKHTKRKKRE